MKALVTGAGGQLGAAIIAAAPEPWRVTGLSRAELDIADAGAVERALDALGPDVIFNAAAFTAVDRAEGEAQAAWRTNRDAPAVLAAAAARSGARIVHVSTDFVFDGARGRPWRPDDRPSPLNLYGRSKLAGEEAVLASGAKALVVRTAWLYAREGRNFLTTMLRLMADEGEVRVVADQVGTPTAAADLAAALWSLAPLGMSGIAHFTNAGVASWYDFALAISQEATSAGVLKREARVRPISTKDFPTPARRPSFSVLDCSAAWAALGAPARHWRAALRAVLSGRSGVE